MTHRCKHCGSPARHRSDPHHRLLFAVIARAFDNWPEGPDEKFKPADAEHLRAYLLIKAGHYNKIDLRCENPDAISLEDQIRAVIGALTDKPTLVHTYPWGIRIFTPKSISYSELGRAEFNTICERIFEVLSAKLRVDIATLKREAELEPA